MQKLAIEYLQQTKERFPDKTAIVDAGGSISFIDLWYGSLALARHLTAGTGGGNLPIVVDIPKSIPAIVAIAAIQLSGNIYVPFDPNSPPRRRQRMLYTLGKSHILSYREGAFYFDDTLIEKSKSLAPEQARMLELELMRKLRRRSNIAPLYIIFTSGTTGMPKGVTISNAAVIDYIDWAAATYQVSEREIIGNQAPLFFDNSVLDLYLSFSRGCTLHLIPNERFLFPNDVLDYIIEQHINFIFFVPSAFANFASLDLLKEYDPSCLKKVLFAGEAMPLNTLKYLRQHLPHALLSNLYGPTEITVDAIYWIFGDELTSLADVPLGLPCENKQIILLNDNNEAVTETDTIAEICVSGIGVSLGYWNDPERSAAAFIQNPIQGHFRETIYRTGDLGYLSSQDGLYYMTGRKDDQIKHMGYRIEPGEIEAAINALEQVHQCCVLYDAEAREILAFYSATSNEPLAAPQSLLREQLPRYMLPKRLIRVTQMPVTQNGKIDRKALWDHYHNKAN
jgi:amino acid adenylation domain-containing protein